MYLCLENKNRELKEDEIYISIIEGKIAYSMLASFDTPVHDIITNIAAPTDFTLEACDKLKEEILWSALYQGHLEFSGMIILRKTDGVSSYDPLGINPFTMRPRTITAEDLITINNGGPLSYKKADIAKNAKLDAYVYERKTVGFLRPDESEITIVSINEEISDEYGVYKTFTIEIQPRYGEDVLWLEGKKVIGEITIENSFLKKKLYR